MLSAAQSVFIRGFGLGISAAAMLFYVWHMESLTHLQQQWLAEQQLQQQVLAQANARATSAQTIDTIDLLMKSYRIADGEENADMRAELIRTGHMTLLLQIQQATAVDISDLVDPGRPFNAAQLYAALLRLKQKHETMQAKFLLDKVLAAQSQPNQP